MTNEGEERETPDEFAHLFRPDSSPVAEPLDDHDDDPSQRAHPAAAGPSDPLDDWEPLVAVPAVPAQEVPLRVPDATPQGGMRLADPPLPELSVAQPEGEQPDSGPGAPVADPTSGRLFRSRGAPERDDVITAIGSMQARRLRSMARADEPVGVDAEVAREERIAPSPAPILPVAVSGEPAPALQVMAGAALADAQSAVQDVGRTQADERQVRRAERRQQAGANQGSGSLTGLGVYAVTIGVTVILAFGETLFFGGEPGIITGIGLLIVSIFAAFAVRTSDGIHAIFAPPIAFFIACITAGQVGVTEAGLTGRAVVVFFLLGGNWIWIVGSTAAALVIVALRRRFS